MSTTLSLHRPETLAVTVYRDGVPSEWNDYCDSQGVAGFHFRSEWALALRRSMKHVPYFLMAEDADCVRGVLPLAFLKSRLFGRHLVSLPYFNSAGVLASDDQAASSLIDEAVVLADSLKVKNLELRHECRIEHEKLTAEMTEKVHMRLALPRKAELAWDGLKSKVRSQVRKPLNNEKGVVTWGGAEKLDEFYAIFSENMRDLGTPTFPKSLFGAIHELFPERVEFCCVRWEGRPAAAAMLVHGPDVTEVPSAGSLLEFRPTGVNMLMFWHLIDRAIQRGQQVFDFGRTTPGTGTWKFKKQWGAEEEPAIWQYYVRKGDATDMRPDSGRFDLFIKCWKKLPLSVSRWLGPKIIRGVP